MKFDVVGPSDLLRTGGAIFLLTRKSYIAKALGLLWLASEVVSLAGREGATIPLLATKATATTATASKTVKGSRDDLLPLGAAGSSAGGTGANPQDRLATPSFMLDGFRGYLGYAG